MPTRAEPAALALPRLPWPLPAVLCWGLGWLLALTAGAAGLGGSMALLGGTAAAAAAALGIAGRWRRLIAAAGFPISALVVGNAQAVPAVVWLAAAALVLLAYPLRAWRDAPFFPTAEHALDGLAGRLALPAGARVLDAGCGLGHGLRALRRVWPDARFEGIEWSRPLAWICARRCHWAAVRRGDMWRQPWDGYALVYLFQRPESMARAAEKAAREMRAGGWLLSLEFEVPGLAPHLHLAPEGGRPLWGYRIGTEGPRCSGSTGEAPRR